MRPSLSADTIHVLVELPSAIFTPLGGEERARLQMERVFQESLGLGEGAWNLPLPGGRAGLTIEIEGRSQHGPAEAHLHACAFGGLGCRLRLRIGASAWMEGDFLFQRFQFDSPMYDAARYAFTAVSDGAIALTPLPTL